MNNDKQQIITRFAPSPTGDPHIGSLRNALYNWLFARANSGKFLLRIEDTDRERFVKGADKKILEMLEWVNLNFDNEIIYQSKRKETYKKYANQLVENNKAYRCFCSQERLEKLRKDQQARRERPRYDGRCRKLSKKEIQAKLSSHSGVPIYRDDRILGVSKGDPITPISSGFQGDKFVIRLKIPEEGKTIVEDIVRGKVIFQNSELDDPILLKSDGFPTYHLAHLVDDHEAGVTHVIRGEEWLPSLPKHVILYQAFGWGLPVFAHLPLILAKDKSKLSKRHGAVSVLEFKDQGYLPEALINFILLLGWHPKKGSEKEIYTREKMLKEFKLEDVQKSAAIFDYNKLNWMNSQYIRSMDLDKLVELSRPFLKNYESGIMNHGYLIKAINLEKDRIKKLSDLPEALKFIFEEIDYEPELLIWEKSDKKTTVDRLTKLIELISNIDQADWTKDRLEKIIKEKIESDNLGVGDTLWPMRVALTSLKNSPGPFEVAEVLEKEKSLDRLKKSIDKLKHEL